MLGIFLINKNWEKLGTSQRDSLLTKSNTILTAQLGGKGTYSLQIPIKKLMITI